MKLSPVSPEAARAGLRAIKTVCGGELTELEAGFVDGVQRHILNTSFDVAALEPIDAAELARVVPPGELRERMIGGMVIASCMDGEASPDELRRIEEFAKAFEISPAILKTGHHLANEQFVLARIDIARRALPGYKAAQIFREEGLPALVRQILPMLGVSNDALTAKYRALGEYPAGTLGRAYFEFITSNQFSFPGESHAGPEAIVTHDLLHVLGGYQTSAEEEVLVASFQAGCRREEPFHAMLFAIAQFHLGISIAPVSTPERLKADPEQMLEAFARGTRITRDMWGDFRPWEHFARPLADVRRELNIAKAC
jgi:hypothetical protein